jgi:hypothetical protein
MPASDGNTAPFELRTSDATPELYVNDVFVEGVTSVTLSASRGEPMSLVIEAVILREGGVRRSPTEYTWVLVPPDD